MNRSSAAGGFTLLEMLVALALLGGLGLLLAGALQTGGLAWRRSRGISEDVALRDGLRLAFEHQLGQAQPVFAGADPGDARLDFLGEPDGVSFLGPLPEAIAPGVLARQRLVVAASTLVLAWQVPGMAEEVLPVLEGVTALRLGYWAPPEAGEEGGWRAEWRDRPRLPGLIALEILRPPAAPLAFLVAPRITATPACLYDPVGPACRHLP